MMTMMSDRDLRAQKSVFLADQINICISLIHSFGNSIANVPYDIEINYKKINELLPKNENLMHEFIHITFGPQSPLLSMFNAAHARITTTVNRTAGLIFHSRKLLPKGAHDAYLQEIEEYKNIVVMICGECQRAYRQ
jgi:hypothetical protein